MTSISDTWNQDQVNDWLKENNFLAFIDKIKSGKVLRQLAKEPGYIEKLATFRSDEEKYTVVSRFKTELLRILTPKITKPFVTQSKPPKHSVTAPPRVSSPLIFKPSPPLSPQANHVVGKKKMEWSLWAKIEYQSPVKISNVNPNEEIQHLKFRVKNVPELGLQTFLLNDFSLKNQHGKTLEPTKKIFEEVQPDEIVYVVLSTPESVIGDFAQFQDVEEPIVVDLKNPELQVFDALPESLDKPPPNKTTNEPLYIVAIGTSAGGLESLQKFFDHMEPDTGMAFVVVQHLSPTHKSMMVEILSKHTAMTVAVAEHECKVLPDHVYVIPPSVDIFIIEGKIYHRAQDRSLGFSYPINTLFVSLALYKKERAVGIIFSGTGTDGQDGVRDIKENGGMVMAQDSSAQFDGMPRSAVNTGLVDFVMPPEEMGNQLKNYISHMDLVNLRAKQNTEETNEDLRHIFTLIHREFGVDFSKYRLSYLLRRIEHRIVLKGLESLHEYRKFLTLDAQEQSLLFVDLMVRVTRFFRDTEVWDAFQSKVIPKLFDELPSGEPLRIWVVGCSTGEEAYTIGILLLEYLDKHERSVPIKIYATDIDKAALEFASNGVYDENIVASVSSDRIARFFVKKGPNYHVVRRLRELVLFAPHNISSDPPFHKLSMVSCRNVLLYFKPILQLKVLSFFHYSLKEEGCLIVGASETINERLTTVFNPMKFERGTKRALTVHIFETKKLSRKVTLSTPEEEFSAKQLLRKTVVPTKSKLLRQYRMMEAVHRVWEAEFVPPSVVVDTCGDVIHHSGDLTLLLNFNEQNIMKMAKSHALSTALGIAMDKANKGDDGENVLVPGVVISGKHHQHNGDGDDLEAKKEKTVINLKVCPIFQNDDRTYVIFFEMIKTEPKSHALFSPRRAPSNSRLTYQQSDNSIYLSRIDDLQQDIDVTQDKLHETQRELEVSHEELQSTNEELLASNEELQSTNEELQSVNEELYALNSEFCAKIEELTELHNDLNNLLSSTSVGTIFLDADLHIRKFTTAVTKHIPVLETDLGRPIGHLANTTYVDLEKDAKKVLETQELVEREIFNASSWYLMRILPYAASDGIITPGRQGKGVVIIFCEITNQKKIEEQLRKAKEDAESALIAKSDFLSTMSHEIRTPMNVICGFTELLLQQNELATDHREYLQYINTSASMMLSLLDDVLDMTQLESGKFHIQAKSFNLPVVIYRVAQFLSLIAVQRNVDFAVYTTPRIPCELIGDALRIQQVLVNLLSNVLNFSKEGGYVKLSLVVNDPPPASNGVKMKVKFILEVENTGTMKSWANKPLNMGLRISRDMINKMNSTLDFSQTSENIFCFNFTIEFPVTGNIPKEGDAVLGGSRDLKDVHVVYFEREGVHSHSVTQMIQEMHAKVTRITSETKIPTSFESVPTHCVISLDHLGSLNKIMALLRGVLPTSVSYCIASGVNQLMDFKTEFPAILLSKPIRLDKLARFFAGEISPSTPRLAPPPNAYSGLKVLLTEDNPMNQKIAVRMLKNLNCEVMVAGNGIQAIDYVIKNPDIHVIFMDLHMPEMDGLSATKRIKEVRESRGLPPIPVVALTAKVSSEGKETCLKTGMVDFISKPLSREKLGETLSRLFPANFSCK